MKKAIAYYRVSTSQQGRSGLGIAAQEKAVNDFIAANGLEMINDYRDMNSGIRNGRDGLKAALKECKQKNAILVIAKLDRLSRSVAFIAALIEANVDFKIVDNPYAGKLIVHIMAAFAEHERDEVSKRTIAALQAAKARGVLLGQYGRNVLSKINAAKAGQFAQSLRPFIEKIRLDGHTTVREIRDEMNRLQIPTFRNAGNKWHNHTVHRILKRLNITKT